MIPLTAALISAWCAMLLGVVSGAVLGLRFATESFGGGYLSWQRRLWRLGHIAWFGIALLTLSHAGTLAIIGSDGSWPIVSSLVVANLSMPLCCYAAAWQQPFRHLFPIPVIATAIGITGTLRELITWI